MQQKERLSLAIPKGRLTDKIQKYFEERGIRFSFDDRKLVSGDEDGRLEIVLVKNTDLPTYVHHAITGLGICGADTLYESGWDFLELLRFPFGSTRICLAGRDDGPQSEETPQRMKVATKFTRFSRDYFHKQGIPVEVIKLNGSVELAPILGLAPYIVDLVETGTTLKANKLSIISELEKIHVYLVANPAYYKLNYRRIDALVSELEETKKENMDETS